MKAMITFDSAELEKGLCNVYFHILESAQSAAKGHVRASKGKGHNPFHFEHFVGEANQAIAALSGILPEYDRRREQFKPLDQAWLELEAKKFLEYELY